MNTDLSSNKTLVNYLIYLAGFIVLSALSFYTIYNIFDAKSNFAIFKSYSLTICFVLLLFLLLYFIFDGLRLYCILKTLNNEVGFKHIVKLVFINLFVSNVTPFASGGGFVQIYYLNKKGVSLGNATAATTIRTVLAMSFIFISTPFIILSNDKFSKIFSKGTVLFYLFLFIVLYLLFFYIVIFKNKLLKKITYNFLNFIKNRKIISNEKFKKSWRKLFKEIDVFSDNLNYFFGGDPKKIFASIFSTLLFLLAEFSFSVVLIIGLGYEISALSIILMQVVIICSMYFAPTPGAAGVAEGSYSLLFSQFVSSNDILPLIFAWRFLTKYLGMFIGMGVVFTGLLGRSK